MKKPYTRGELRQFWGRLAADLAAGRVVSRARLEVAQDRWDWDRCAAGAFSPGSLDEAPTWNEGEQHARSLGEEVRDEAAGVCSMVWRCAQAGKDPRSTEAERGELLRLVERLRA